MTEDNHRPFVLNDNDKTVRHFGETMFKKPSNYRRLNLSGEWQPICSARVRAACQVTEKPNWHVGVAAEGG